MSRIESLFCEQIDAMGLPKPVREYRFHPVRRWRFDFAYPSDKLAIELEGGIWVRGRHNRPAGFARDCEKYNEAALLGWRVYRFTADKVESGEAVEFISQYFCEPDYSRMASRRVRGRGRLD